MNYDVTIGIPVYQAEAYLTQSLLSALNQSYASIEFLVVDDGCTDRSMDVVRKFQREHSRGDDIHILSGGWQSQGTGLLRRPKVFFCISWMPMILSTRIAFHF